MTLNRLHKAFAVLAMVLGVAHIIYGFVVFKSLTLETYWFHGAGVAMILTGLANLQNDKAWILNVQNALMFGFISVLVILAPEPQVWAGIVLFGGLLLMSLFKQRTYAVTPEYSE